MNKCEQCVYYYAGSNISICNACDDNDSGFIPIDNTYHLKAKLLIIRNKLSDAKIVIDAAEKIIDEFLNEKSTSKISKINLLEKLSTRAKTAIKYANDNYDLNLVYLSDFVNFANKSKMVMVRGRLVHIDFFKLRNFGMKSYDEILVYIKPYLQTNK